MEARDPESGRVVRARMVAPNTLVVFDPDTGEDLVRFTAEPGSEPEWLAEGKTRWDPKCVQECWQYCDCLGCRLACYTVC